MIDLAEIKLFLRLDTDAEDSMLISFSRMAAEYLQGACGVMVNLGCERARFVQLMLISDWFENRTPYTAGKYSQSISSIILQLQLETEAM